MGGLVFLSILICRDLSYPLDVGNGPEGVSGRNVGSPGSPHDGRTLEMWRVSGKQVKGIFGFSDAYESYAYTILCYPAVFKSTVRYVQTNTVHTSLKKITFLFKTYK